ncbi:MAG: hypothetical protein KDK78_05600, partial [Chlamydiia bacterium]|nr:hypothetical protein [Chlamydiia bacterium]
MKKFRFNLENVLKLRESHEKVAQRKVQEVQEELNQVERKIEELRNESDALQKVQPGRNKGSSTSGAEMRAYFEYYQ